MRLTADVAAGLAELPLGDRVTALMTLRRQSPVLFDDLAMRDEYLPPILREAVELAGGPSRCVDRLNAIGTIGWAIAVAHQISGSDVVDSALLSVVGLPDEQPRPCIVVAPHLSHRGLVPIVLHASGWSFSTLATGPASGPLRTIDATSPTAGLVIARRLMRGEAVVWQPDAVEPPVGGEYSFLGHRRRASAVIARLAAAYEARFVFAGAYLRDPPEAGAVTSFEAFDIGLARPDAMGAVMRHSEELILRHVDQWRLWRFMRRGRLP